MKSKEMRNHITIIGKFNQVSKYLKECEKKYTYIYELIEDLKLQKNKSAYIN